MRILGTMLFFGLVCSLVLMPGWLSAAEPAKPVTFQTIPGALPAQLDPDDNANLSRMSNRALDAALRARQAYFEQAGLDALAKDALNSPEQAPAASLPDPGLAADLRGAGLTSVGGTVDEPTGEVALPVDPALSCPGFYILRTHPGAGSLGGRIGAEILLDGSGLRTLQGGLNFGGQATASIRGFSAFSIANANDEEQVVNIGLDAAASGRLVLERRSGGTTTVLIDQAVGSGETDVTATVAPGFYVVGFQPNRSEPTNYTVAALTSFTDRAGGGFQGGVVFGGYHNPARESTGFGGFCIAEAFDVSVSVLSQPTYGSSGAKGLAFSVSSGDGAVFLDSRASEGPEGVQRPSLVEAVAADTETASISWLPARAPQTSPGSIEYRLHLANNSGFTPNGATQRLSVSGETSVALTGLQAGSEQYVKVEAWANGQSLGWSNELLLAIPSIDPVVRTDQNIWVLDQSNVDDLEIQSDRITYRRLDDSLTPADGDLVVSALQDGLTRTVTSVSSSGGREILQTETEEAPLEAIFEQAHIRNSFNLADIEDSSRGNEPQIQTTRRKSDGRLVRRATWPASGMTLVQEGAQSDSIDVVLQSIDGGGLQSAGTAPRVNQDASEGEINSKTFFNALTAQWPEWVSAFPDEPFTFDINVETLTGEYQLNDLRLQSLTAPGSLQAVPISINQVTQTSDRREAEVTISPQRQHADDQGRAHVARFQAVAEQVQNCSFLGCRTREVDFEVEIYVGAQLGGASVDWDLGAPDGSIRLRGDFTVDLEPDVQMEVDRRGFGVDYALFTVAAKPISFRLNSRLDTTGSGQYQGRVEDIFTKRFWKVIPAGNVPILISGTLSLDAQLTLDATAEIDLEHQLELSYELEKGVEYIRGQGYRVISPEVESEESYELTGQATGEAGLDIRLIPQLDVGIYEIAFGRSRIEPYLAANTALEGAFARSSDGSFDDENFRFTELHAGIGMDIGLRFDAGIADLTILGWPSRDPDDFWTTPLIPEFTLIELPQISLDVDETARLPGRDEARRIQAQINNTSPLHPWVPESADWSIALGGSADLIADPDDPLNRIWLEPNGAPQDYTIRFSGYGRLGAYARQTEDINLSSDLWSGTTPAPGDTFKDCPDCPTMVNIPAGTFTQGSPPDEPERRSNEGPQRTVNVPAFALGQTEVTFEQWDACVDDGGCSHNPSDFWGRGDRPVINVSWHDAKEYVAWLSAVTGEDYRLPSESEWEYATRAGTTGSFNTGDCITTDQANFRGTSPAQACPAGVYRQQTLPVASFAPNAFGLYDTHGNVWEWVQDCWNSSYNGAPTDGSAWMTGNCSWAMLRGGSWRSSGQNLRSAYRTVDTRGGGYFGYGFRVAARGVQQTDPPSNFNLQVRSIGASNVSIQANPSAYAGTTNYQKTDIPDGTSIALTAPSSRGDAQYNGWSGCNSVSNLTCTVNMDRNKTVTVSYETDSAPPLASGRLNDTGFESCANWTDNFLSCPLPTFPGQDAEHGRDALAAAGSLQKTGSGLAGFDFTKLDSSGNELPATASNWSCVRDNHTGLTWEVKSDNPDSFRYSENYFTWYDPDGSSNGGDSGQQDGANCDGGIACDTNSYVSAVNNVGLCGINSWRLPAVGELRSILNFAKIDPAIDPEFFPEQYQADRNNRYWTNQTGAKFSDDAWKVDLGWAFSTSSFKDSSGKVRLVAGGAAGGSGSPSLSEPQCDRPNIPRTASSSRYEIIEGGAVVQDTVTGLEWQRCSIGQQWSNGQCTGDSTWPDWRDALQDAQDEPGDWRLPNVNELESLVEYCKVDPAINTQAFPGTPSAPFWSSTPRNKGTDVGGESWIVGFEEGNTWSGQMVLNAKARLVRGLVE